MRGGIGTKRRTRGRHRFGKLSWDWRIRETGRRICIASYGEHDKLKETIDEVKYTNGNIEAEGHKLSRKKYDQYEGKHNEDKEHSNIQSDRHKPRHKDYEKNRENE